MENYLTERKAYLESNNLFDEEEKQYFEWGIEKVARLNPILVNRN